MFRVVLQDNPQWKEPWVTKLAFDLNLFHILREWCPKVFFCLFCFVLYISKHYFGRQNYIREET